MMKQLITVLCCYVNKGWVWMQLIQVWAFLAAQHRGKFGSDSRLAMHVRCRVSTYPEMAGAVKSCVNA